MKNSFTRKVEKDIRLFYPDCYVEVEENSNGDGERSLHIFMNRDFAKGLFKHKELGGLKAVVWKHCKEKYNYYLLNDGGATNNATVETEVEILT